jgi:hypothetical protein
VQGNGLQRSRLLIAAAFIAAVHVSADANDIFGEVSRAAEPWLKREQICLKGESERLATEVPSVQKFAAKMWEVCQDERAEVINRGLISSIRELLATLSDTQRDTLVNHYRRERSTQP